jgi:hypothetical protein
VKEHCHVQPQRRKTHHGPTTTLPPVRPHVRAGGPALGAHQTRAERGHREIAREVVDLQDHLMPALQAHHVERPNTVLTHVLQRHRLDRVVEMPSAARRPLAIEATPYRGRQKWPPIEPVLRHAYDRPQRLPEKLPQQNFPGSISWMPRWRARRDSGGLGPQPGFASSSSYEMAHASRTLPQHCRIFRLFSRAGGNLEATLAGGRSWVSFVSSLLLL